MSENTIKFIKFRESATIPAKAHPEDAGYDVFMNKEFTTVDSKKCIITFNTGIGIVPPTGYYFILVERSSCYKSPFQLINKIGIIDQNYRGEVKAVMKYTPVKFSDDINLVSLPDFPDTLRILQLIPVKCAPNFDIVVSNTIEAEEQTVRGDGGFGSSDTSGVGVKPGLEVKNGTTILTLPDGSTFSPTQEHSSSNFTMNYSINGRENGGQVNYSLNGTCCVTPSLVSEIQHKVWEEQGTRTPSISSRGLFL